MFSIPFFSLQSQHQSIQKELRHAFSKIENRGRFILSEEVSAFEDAFAAFQNSKYCVSVANGYEALWISLKLFGIGKGDEVIVPSHTCQATWLAVANTGAKPVPVEVDPFIFTMDPLLIESVISSRTKAIVPVHLYGHPCRMDRIISIAKTYKLKVIEDNAQAHGAFYQNKMTGSWGDCNATSFYPTKNLGALGDGGAITTSDKKLAALAKAIRNYGSSKKDIHPILGINSRLDELQAALLSVKLKKLKHWNNQRRQNAKLYFEVLKNVGDIQLPPRTSTSAKPVFHQFVIQTNHRDRLKKYLEGRGIETAIHYPIPIHLQKAYEYLKYKKGSLPVAEKLSQTVLSLPIWPGLKKAEIELIGSEVRNFFG